MSLLGALFCLVFLAQVFIISIYFPRKFKRRIEYILANHPPDRYPKLYPAPVGFDAVGAGRRALRTYWGLNLVVAAIGIAAIAAALARGYTPGPKGGSEIFVVLYFALQMVPHILAEVSTVMLYKLMRHVDQSTIKRAELSRRRLTDYVSPNLVRTAIVLFVAWMGFYLYGQGLTAALQSKTYVTLITMFASQGFFAWMIFRALHGKKPDPHMAGKDRTRQIGATVRVAVFSSVAVSAFLIIMDAVRMFGLDVIEPALVSAYLQVVMIVAFNLTCRALPLSSIDFDVYRGGEPTPAG